MKIAGSNPAWVTKICWVGRSLRRAIYNAALGSSGHPALGIAGIVQLVERMLPKHQVTGSSPVSRSKFCLWCKEHGTLAEELSGLDKSGHHVAGGQNNFGAIVQTGERFVRNEEVVGSIPSRWKPSQF